MARMVQLNFLFVSGLGRGGRGGAAERGGARVVGAEGVVLSRRKARGGKCNGSKGQWLQSQWLQWLEFQGRRQRGVAGLGCGVGRCVQVSTPNPTL